MRVLWITGVIFAITQMGMVFFTYIYLLEEIKVTPIAAGIFASNLQLAGLLGRPLFGWVCDRIGRAEYVLVGIAVLTVTAGYVLLHVQRDWSIAAFFFLALACGAAGQTWNAVFTAAMSEYVEREKLAEMNGRAFAFLSFGWMSAPPLCWFLVETFGNYRPMYMTLMALNALVAIVLLIWMLRTPRRVRS